jgi:hypothetical protein
VTGNTLAATNWDFHLNKKTLQLQNDVALVAERGGIDGIQKRTKARNMKEKLENGMKITKFIAPKKTKGRKKRRWKNGNVMDFIDESEGMSEKGIKRKAQRAGKEITRSGECEATGNEFTRESGIGWLEKKENGKTMREGWKR